jgi:protein TonB
MKPLKIDLEHTRFIFREVGIIITLAAVLLAFELKSYDRSEIGFLTRSFDSTPEEFVEITHHEKPPPPPPKVSRQTSLIAIVENEMEIEEEIVIDVEADQETVMQDYQPDFSDDLEEEDQMEEEEPIFIIVESMPMFPGGEEARLKYLNENVKYPVMAKEAGIQGKVFLEFVVEKDGAVSGVRVIRGIGGGCDEEALRVVENMPRWIPGKQRGVPVRVRFNMPIRFVLL